MLPGALGTARVYVLPYYLPLQALAGTLATTLMSPVKSAMDLKRIHANIQEQGATFPLVESELEWAVCRMGQQSTEVMNEVMNIITALLYHKHPSVKVLCEPRPLEAIQGLLKVCCGVRTCSVRPDGRESLFACVCVSTAVKHLLLVDAR